MARALPCLGSTVGGIPELLAAEDLVRPDEPQTLATAICDVLADPDRMRDMAVRNLDRARDFATDALRPRREAFYAELRQAVERLAPIASHD
jgi:phosphatidylinositol alpha-1,6-mannosyltransferase